MICAVPRFCQILASMALMALPRSALGALPMRRLERVCSAAAFCVPARVSRVAPDRAGHAAKSSLCSGVRSLVAMSRCVCGRGLARLCALSCALLPCPALTVCTPACTRFPPPSFLPLPPPPPWDLAGKFQPKEIAAKERSICWKGGHQETRPRCTPSSARQSPAPYHDIR